MLRFGFGFGCSKRTPGTPTFLVPGKGHQRQAMQQPLGPVEVSGLFSSSKRKPDFREKGCLDFERGLGILPFFLHVCGFYFPYCQNEVKLLPYVNVAH